MQAAIRCGKAEDMNRLFTFLKEANLGTEGICEETVDYFLLLEDDEGDLKGTLGIEPYGEAGLLRSLVISKGMTEKDILVLFNQMLLLAKEKKLEHLYLATNKASAIPFFEMLGFHKVEYWDLPEKLGQSNHIQHVKSVDNSLFLKFSF